MSERIYEKSYFDRHRWLLEKYQQLDISQSEAMVILMVFQLADTGHPVTLEELSTYTKLDIPVVDEVINSLVTKGFLSLRMNKKRLQFVFDGLYDAYEKGTAQGTKEIFAILEEVFGRPLTPVDYQYLEKWQAYSKRDVIEAIKEAVVAGKNDIRYIDRILLKRSAK
ncbi:MAG: DnaD domain protein [Erysipelotrichaceae bacterium]|jgi:DNA replication protein|nr:DnaD domain protein [Erysipelotrichaceae bacterium]